MKKKEAVATEKTTIGLKCGDCMHFKRTPYYEKTCTNLGVKHYANAPKCYSPDVYQLVENTNPEALSKLGLWLKDLSAKQSRILIAVLKRQGTMEKNYKLKFGQPVYFCFGQSYLSNYFVGYALSAADGADDQVYVGSTLNKRQRKNPMMVTLPRSSVYTVTEFKKLREKLVKEKRIKDPNPLFSPTPTLRVTADYEVPSMEKASPDWYDKVKKAKPKKGKGYKQAINGDLTFKI